MNDSDVSKVLPDSSVTKQETQMIEPSKTNADYPGENVIKECLVVAKTDKIVPTTESKPENLLVKSSNVQESKPDDTHSIGIQDGKLTFFQKCKQFHISKCEDGKERVETKLYLDAGTSLSEFVASIGIVFVPISADILQNICIIREFYNKDSKNYKYLDNLVTGVKQTTDINTTYLPPVINALLWTHRTMVFFHTVLSKVCNDFEQNKIQEDISPHFRTAYDVSLAPHQTWFMGLMFDIVLSATPTRSIFIKHIKGESQLSEKDIFEQIKLYHTNLAPVNEHVKEIIVCNGFVP